MDKIQYYNNLVKIKGNQKEVTQNFLDGILFYFFNIEFFFTFLKALNRKFKAIVIYPSFHFKENGNTKEAKMEQLIFRVEGVNNDSICKMLNKSLNRIKNRHGTANVSFRYETKQDTIYLEVHSMIINRGGIKSVTKNQYSKQ